MFRVYTLFYDTKKYIESKNLQMNDSARPKFNKTMLFCYTFI